jgi:DNA ligase-associated metallophosphoesterase
VSDVTVTLATETCHLLPERALWWPREQTLFITDTHFGKAASFRQLGVPVPGGQTAADLRRLTAVLVRTAAQRLVILGDLLHARVGRTPQVLDAVADWRRQHVRLAVALVPGNHDRAAGPPPAEWQIERLPDDAAIGPFLARHEPTFDGDRHVLAGHLHPAIRLRGLGRDSLKLPCFWLRERLTLLPAFSSFVDGWPIAPEPGDAVYAVTPDDVLPVPSTDQTPRPARFARRR